MNIMKSKCHWAVVLGCLGILAAGESHAAIQDVYLRVDNFGVPAGTYGANQSADIAMWGFDLTDVGFTPPADLTAWAPLVLTATEGDTLRVHIQNDLTGPFTEPVSLVIPGQAIPAGGPTWTDGTTGARTDPAQRVRSFTAETAVGATLVYDFPALKAGTYLIESGTHPAVQVQMGLYGVLKVYPSTVGQAYDDASSAFDSEATLLYSEIDPLLHAAVAAGTYGPGTSMTSTVDYQPRYFLVNGQPYTSGAPKVAGGLPGQQLLIRLLNAGLETKVPLVQGPYLSVIAEDGNLITATTASGVVIPASKEQYSVLLPAGKTMDALLIPTGTADIPVYDRRLNLSNAGESPGGMLSYLTVTQTPILAANRAMVGFGLVARGTTSPARTVKVTNTGNVDATVPADIVDGGAKPNASMFSVTPPGPVTVTVAPGYSAAFSVTFSPAAAPSTIGLKTAVLRFTSNDVTHPTLDVAIQGRAN